MEEDDDDFSDTPMVDALEAELFDEERIEGEEEFIRQNPHVIMIDRTTPDDVILNNLKSKATILEETLRGTETTLDVTFDPDAPLPTVIAPALTWEEVSNPALGVPYATGGFVGPPSDIVPSIPEHWAQEAYEGYARNLQAERRTYRLHGTMSGNAQNIPRHMANFPVQTEIGVGIIEDESAVYRMRDLNLPLFHRDMQVGHHLRLHERYPALQDHWFGACQIAKYLIRSQKADQYWDAGFISKRHVTRMLRTGWEHERRESHFRMLLGALYQNRRPQALYHAVGSCYENRRVALAAEYVRGELMTADQRAAVLETRLLDVRNMVFSCLWYEDFVFHKQWRSSTVVDMAIGIFKEEAFDRMPILADAIEDTGCQYMPMLQYLRGENVAIPGQIYGTSKNRYGRTVRPASVFQPLWTRGSYILKKILGDRFSNRRLP